MAITIPTLTVKEKMQEHFQSSKGDVFLHFIPIIVIRSFGVACALLLRLSRRIVVQIPIPSIGYQSLLCSFTS